jgi:cobalt-zinc-cadmium efflux system protein
MDQKEKSSQTKKPTELGNIKAAFLLNTGFIILEMVGGLLTNSMAILSDALHDLGDSLSLGLTWYFQKLSGRKKDRHYSFGYKRFSLLGAVVNSVVLVTGSVLVLNETVPRLFNPQPSDARGMFVLALLGILVNGFTALKLHRGKSISEKVVTLHLLEDVLGWAAVLIGSIVMILTRLSIIDPILSLLITLLILFNVFKNLRMIFRVFLQAVPKEINLEQIEKKILAVPGVSSIHDLHIWTLDGQYNILTLHLIVEDIKNVLELKKIKQEIKSLLKDSNIQHITVEIESPDDECYLDSCQ